MTCRKRLVVNADGFGFGPGATRGILEAIRDGGLISSVSVNANFPEAEQVPALLSMFPSVSIGVHLNPMAGRPCLKPDRVPSLVDGAGELHNHRFPDLLRRGAIEPRELEEELDAQIAKVKDLAGERLTHLDSQGNQHLGYLGLFLKLADKWGIRRMRNNESLICLEAGCARRARLAVYLGKPHVWAAHRYRRLQMRKARRAGMRMADRLITVGYAGNGNKSIYDNWVRVLQNLPGGTSEMYCHPAYPDETLRRWSVYLEERERELAILRRKELREIAHDANVEIVSFDAI